MKRTEIKRKTPMKRVGFKRLKTAMNAYVAAGTLQPKRKAMRKKRRTPRKWANANQRRMYVADKSRCEYGEFNGCTSVPTDAEHFLGRGRYASDDPRALLALCRQCHDDVRRSRAAAVNGLWLKLYRIREVGITVGYETALLIEFWESLGFRIDVLAVWMADGTLRTEPVRRRAQEVMEWCEVTPLAF